MAETTAHHAEVKGDTYEATPEDGEKKGPLPFLVVKLELECNPGRHHKDEGDQRGRNASRTPAAEAGKVHGPRRVR